SPCGPAGVRQLRRTRNHRGRGKRGPCISHVQSGPPGGSQSALPHHAVADRRRGGVEAAMSRVPVLRFPAAGLLAAALSGLVGAAVAGAAPAAASTGPGEAVVIRATMDDAGRFVYFDPVGIWVEPGTTIRWVLERSFHSVAAY